jgi:hypothetical protein
VPIPDSEINAIKQLNISGASIKSLQRLRDFIHIIKYPFISKYRAEKKAEWKKEYNNFFSFISLAFGISLAVIVLVATLFSLLGIVVLVGDFINNNS